MATGLPPPTIKAGFPAQRDAAQAMSLIAELRPTVACQLLHGRIGRRAADENYVRGCGRNLFNGCGRQIEQLRALCDQFIAGDAFETGRIGGAHHLDASFFVG